MLSPLALDLAENLTVRAGHWAIPAAIKYSMAARSVIDSLHEASDSGRGIRMM